MFLNRRSTDYSRNVPSSFPADLLTIDMPLVGVTEGGQIKMGLELNLTDSTGRRFEDRLGPGTVFPDPIDLNHFDSAKGFLIERTSSDPQSNRGILFSIDSLEQVDPDSVAPEPITLQRGIHLSWPVDARGFVLEEAESVKGPWVQSSAFQAVVGDQVIVELAAQSESKLFRLVRPF